VLGIFLSIEDAIHNGTTDRSGSEIEFEARSPGVLLEKSERFCVRGRERYDVSPPGVFPDGSTVGVDEMIVARAVNGSDRGHGGFYTMGGE